MKGQLRIMNDTKPTPLEQLAEQAAQAQRDFDEAQGKLKQEQVEAQREADPAKVNKETVNRVVTAREALTALLALLEEAKSKIVTMDAREVGIRVARQMLVNEADDAVTISFTGKSARAVRAAMKLSKRILAKSGETDTSDESLIGYSLYRFIATEYERRMEQLIESGDQAKIDEIMSCIIDGIAKEVFGPGAKPDPDAQT